MLFDNNTYSYFYYLSPHLYVLNGLHEKEGGNDVNINTDCWAISSICNMGSWVRHRSDIKFYKPRPNVTRFDQTSVRAFSLRDNRDGILNKSEKWHVRHACEHVFISHTLVSRW